MKIQRGNGPCSKCGVRVEDIPIKDPVPMPSGVTVWSIDGDVRCANCGFRLLQFVESAMLDLSVEKSVEIRHTVEH